MKPVTPEKYVDGMQVENDGERLSAHDILAQHVTNVAPVTAKAIEQAIKEYELLTAMTQAPKKDLMAALSSVADLAHAIELLEAFARAAQTAAIRLRDIQVVPPTESYRPPARTPSSLPPSNGSSEATNGA